MRLAFMRWVDFWIGVPICFLLSVLAAGLRLLGLGKVPQPFEPRKILFIELSEMGSTVLAYGAMERARDRFNADLYFLIFKENAESVRLLGIIPEENLLTIRSRSLTGFLIDTVRVIFRMRAERLDAVIDLELFSRFTSMLTFLSGATAKVGYYRYQMEGLYRGTFQTHKVMYNPYYHMSRNFLALVRAIELPPSSEPMLKERIPVEDTVQAKVDSDPELKAAVIEKFKKLMPDFSENHRIVLFNTGAGAYLTIRKWPTENYIELGRRIVETPDTLVVMVGVKADTPEAKTICEGIGSDRCMDFTGQTANLRELVEVFHLSRVLVSNDSGPPHFASLTDIRIVVLFGPETPALYGAMGPHAFPVFADLACSPCLSAYNHRNTSCRDNQCLQAITPDQVYDQIRPAIQ